MQKKVSIFHWFFFVCIFSFTLCGILIINIINTKALSPLGNTNKNYKLVSAEFGQDFSNFIKDNSPLKIYKEKDDLLIRIGESNFIVSNRMNYMLNKKDVQVNEVEKDSK